MSPDGIALFERIRYRRHDGSVFMYVFDLMGLACGPALKNLSLPKVESGPIAGLAPQPYLWICCHNLKARQARVPSGSSPSWSAGPQASIQLFLWVAARTRAPQAAQATSSRALACWGWLMVSRSPAPTRRSSAAS